MTYISKNIELPPKETFPGAEKEVWTASGKKLTEATKPIAKKRRIKKTARGRANVEDARWIKAKRIEAGLTQTELADLIGCGQVTISNWENGQKAFREGESYKKIKELFLNGQEPPKVPETPVMEEPKAPAEPIVEETIEQPKATAKANDAPPFELFDILRKASSNARSQVATGWTDTQELYFLKGIQTMEDAMLNVWPGK